MTDASVRQVITELFAGQGWPEGGDELQRSLGPRSPELLLDAPGWLRLVPGALVLDAGCREATYGIALARRYGCRVLGVDLVAAWPAGGGPAHPRPGAHGDRPWTGLVPACPGLRPVAPADRARRAGAGPVRAGQGRASSSVAVRPASVARRRKSASSSSWSSL
jgi:hypothetical protein